jgi:L-lactate dehydrogenase complex protein LldE
VIFPQGQTCCGQPAFNSGYREEARRVARVQLDAFPEDLPVVVPSASCAGMLKVHYPALFAGTPMRSGPTPWRGGSSSSPTFWSGCWTGPRTWGRPSRSRAQLLLGAPRAGVAPATLELLGRLANVEAVEPDRATGVLRLRRHLRGQAAGDLRRHGRGQGQVHRPDGGQRPGGSGLRLPHEPGGTLARNGLPVRHIAELLWERTGAGRRRGS